MRTNNGGSYSTNVKSAQQVIYGTPAPKKKNSGGGSYNPFQPAISAVNQAITGVEHGLSAVGPAFQHLLQNQVTVHSPSGAPLYYTVKGNEQSLADVANQVGVPETQLSLVNNLKTLPPKGTRLAVTSSQHIAAEYGNNYGYNGSSSLGYNTAPRPTTTGYGPHNQGRPDNTPYVQANAVQSYVNQNHALPNSIPVGALGLLKDPQGNPMTLSVLAQLGYRSDGQGNYVLPGATTGATSSILGSGSGSSQPDLAHTLVTFNRNAKNKHSKFTTTAKWAANAYKRKKQHAKGGGSHAAPTAPVTTGSPTTTTGVPTTVLDIHLGSG